MPELGALLDTLEGFAATLTASAGVDDVMHALAHETTCALDLMGAGVLLLRQGRLTYVSAPVGTVADLARTVEDSQAGPCVDAVRHRQAVVVGDLAVPDYAARWPDYAARAKAGHIRAVAAIPMLAGDEVLGTLGLYETRPHEWTGEDLRVAGILAAIAGSYLRSRSALEQQRRAVDQLEQALRTRVVIEQAKGVLAGRRGISIDAAFGILRKHARDHNTRLHDVAAAVVDLRLQP